MTLTFSKYVRHSFMQQPETDGKVHEEYRLAGVQTVLESIHDIIYWCYEL